MEKKPVLSICIIFKNEIRCLERCLKSLQPLREAVPCELVMADTGSTDGSREVAERYADILVDFPWVDDFAAARNAALERASGEWCLSVDADEWLAGDFSQLTAFLGDPEKKRKYVQAAVMIRNFVTEDLESQYTDFLAVRMANMSLAPRYHGAIHEQWTVKGDIYGMDRVVFHHDGYVGLGKEKGRSKRERNMRLLKEKLEEKPEDLQTLLQCVESSGHDPESDEYLERALAGVRAKRPGWENLGPPILRYAVNDAQTRKSPELEPLAEEALGLFPDSPFVTIDIAFIMLRVLNDRKEYARAIPYGERYLRAIAEYRQGGQIVAATLRGSLAMTSPVEENAAHVLLADAYFHENEPEKSRDTLRPLKGETLTEECTRNCVGAMINLHTQTGLDLSGDMARLWEELCAPVPTGKRAAERRDGVAAAASLVFSKAHRDQEDAQGFRHGYTLFLPLAGRCEWGTAAAVLESGSPEEIQRLLSTVEHWEQLPGCAVARAIQMGVHFPLLEKPLELETTDILAVRLVRERESIYEILQIASSGDFAGSWQDLIWARALALAAVKTFDWERGAQGGVDLARIFARVEQAFITACYSPEVLREGNLCVLPAMHRFGWYCAQAFAALDSGDQTGYVRFLREGLESCAQAKPIVECLLSQLEESQKVQDLPELLALAERVRTLLAQYPADDPAIETLKQSAAYQKVSHLIEEPAWECLED